MASDTEYYKYISEQLSKIDGISYRKMMGEYIIYYKNKVLGGIYDNRFLVKDTPSARRILKNAAEEIPYQGAKNKMLLVEQSDNQELLTYLIETMYDELPFSKKKKR